MNDIHKSIEESLKGSADPNNPQNTELKEFTVSLNFKVIAQSEFLGREMARAFVDDFMEQMEEDKQQHMYKLELVE